MLDMRKDHVKFWRPQMLLMVSNPLTCCDLIDFINDIKKGGLYVLGHVETGHFETERGDFCQKHYGTWLSLVDFMKIKAFVELTMAPSIREGMQHLVRISGLGGMKPNTICFGFYDQAVAVNSLVTRGRTPPSSTLRKKLYTMERGNGIDAQSLSHSGSFPNPRAMGSTKELQAAEYVQMLHDTAKMNKNICLFRHFHDLNKEVIFASKTRMYIDVWPVNAFRPDTSNIFDNTCLFLLQLACILHMVPGWNKHTVLRIFMCADSDNDETSKKEKKLSQLLKQLRILGQIQTVMWDHVTCLLDNSQAESASPAARSHQEGPLPALSDEYLQAMNELIKSYSTNTAITFFYLPPVPRDTGDLQVQYLHYLDELTQNLPPTVLVHGIHPVTSTTL